MSFVIGWMWWAVSETCIGIPGCSTPTVPWAESWPGTRARSQARDPEDAPPADEPGVDVIEVYAFGVVAQVSVGKLHHAADLRLVRRARRPMH